MIFYLVFRDTYFVRRIDGIHRLKSFREISDCVSLSFFSKALLFVVIHCSLFGFNNCIVSSIAASMCLKYPNRKQAYNSARGNV